MYSSNGKCNRVIAEDRNTVCNLDSYQYTFSFCKYTVCYFCFRIRTNYLHNICMLLHGEVDIMFFNSEDATNFINIDTQRLPGKKCLYRVIEYFREDHTTHDAKQGKQQVTC